MPCWYFRRLSLVLYLDGNVNTFVLYTSDWDENLTRRHISTAPKRNEQNLCRSQPFSCLPTGPVFYFNNIFKLRSINIQKSCCLQLLSFLRQYSTALTSISSTLVISRHQTPFRMSEINISTWRRIANQNRINSSRRWRGRYFVEVKPETECLRQHHHHLRWVLTTLSKWRAFKEVNGQLSNWNKLQKRRSQIPWSDSGSGCSLKYDLTNTRSQPV